MLLDNAIKHGDGAIAVSGEISQKSVRLSVHDSGPGIAPKLLPDLFERFVTGSDDNAGVGLGLAIAKALVEAQGGTIRVESQVGESSAFTVTLPQAATPHRAPSSYA